MGVLAVTRSALTATMPTWSHWQRAHQRMSATQTAASQPMALTPVTQTPTTIDTSMPGKSAPERQHGVARAVGASGAAGQETHKWYCYAVSDEVISKTAFIDVHGLTTHTIESLHQHMVCHNLLQLKEEQTQPPPSFQHQSTKRLCMMSMSTPCRKQEFPA